MPPGWYVAQGDPPGTLRWWDGHQWQGGPVLAGGYPGYGVPSRDALPELGRVLAGPWHRVAASLIDTLITMAISIPVLLLTTDFDDFRDANYFEVDLTTWSVLTSAALLLAEIAFIALKGATPGKLALGIAIIGQDGTSPPGWRKAALRNVLVLLGFVPVVNLVVGLLGTASLILLFADPRRRTIEDRIATTYVVRSR
jgi:uncharacterized RDD family membrane protein YckC